MDAQLLGPARLDLDALQHEIENGVELTCGTEAKMLALITELRETRAEIDRMVAVAGPRVKRLVDLIEAADRAVTATKRENEEIKARDRVMSHRIGLVLALGHVGDGMLSAAAVYEALAVNP